MDPWITNQPEFISVSLPGVKITTPLGAHLANASYSSAVTAVATPLRRAAKDSEDLVRVETPRPQVFRDFQRNHQQPLIAATGRLLKTLRQENEKANSAEREWLKPPRTPGDLRVASILELLKNKKSSEIIGAMHKDAEIAFIVFEFYDLLDLPEAGRAELERSVIAANIQRAFEKSYVKTPTMADPLGERPSVEIASELAAQTIANHEAIRADIHAGIRWMDTVLDFASVMSDTPKPTVFAEVAKLAA